MTARTLEELLASLVGRVGRLERRLNKPPPGPIPTPDTGWLDLTDHLLAGYTSTSLSARIIANRLYVRGTVTGTFDPDVGTADFTEAIPVELRPPGNLWGPGYIAGQAVSVVLRSAGTMAYSNRFTTSGTSLQFNISGLID